MLTYQTSAPHILLIENDVMLSKMICEYIESQGYRVLLAHSGYQATRMMRRRTHHLVVLDNKLPDISGLEWLQSYRQQSRNPLILLIDNAEDPASGLESGADECLAKPLCLPELTERMKALLRRHETTRIQPEAYQKRGFRHYGSYHDQLYSHTSYRGLIYKQPDRAETTRVDRSGTLVSGPLTLNPTTGVTTIYGRDVSLTGAEQRILELLMGSAGSVVSMHDIGIFALGRVLTRFDRSIGTHISSLRRKLGMSVSGPRPIIRNLRGQGYVLAIDDQAARLREEGA